MVINKRLNIFEVKDSNTNDVPIADMDIRTLPDSSTVETGFNVADIINKTIRIPDGAGDTYDALEGIVDLSKVTMIHISCISTNEARALGNTTIQFDVDLVIGGTSVPFGKTASFSMDDISSLYVEELIISGVDTDGDAAKLNILIGLKE